MRETRVARLIALFILAGMFVGALFLKADFAFAVMADPTNKFEFATDEQKKKILDIRKLNLVGRFKNFELLQFDFVSSRQKFFVVRVEGNYCSDSCLTAFFKGDISNEGLEGVGYFGKKATFNDVWHQLHDGCGRVFTLSFVSIEGKFKSIGFSECGIIF